jgi:hypothetical protein
VPRLVTCLLARLVPKTSQPRYKTNKRIITKNSDRTLAASIRWVVVDLVRGCLLPLANAITPGAT